MRFQLAVRERRILVAATAVLSLFVLDKTVLRGHGERGETLEEEVSREEAAYARDQRLLDRRKEIIRQYAGLVHGAPRPSSEEMTGLLSEIETIARRHGVKLLDMKPQKQSKGEESPSVSIQAEGAWEALAAFVLAVEGSPSLLRVEKGTLRLRGDESPLLETQLLIRRLAAGNDKNLPERS